MGKDDWITCWVEKALVQEIDKYIASPKSKYFGSKKYTSRPDFIRDACLRLLEKETGKKVEVAAR